MHARERVCTHSVERKIVKSKGRGDKRSFDNESLVKRSHRPR